MFRIRLMLIDLHCDTIYSLWEGKGDGDLVSSSLSVDRKIRYTVYGKEREMETLFHLHCPLTGKSLKAQALQPSALRFSLRCMSIWVKGIETSLHGRC